MQEIFADNCFSFASESVIDNLDTMVWKQVTTQTVAVIAEMQIFENKTEVAGVVGTAAWST